MKPQKHSATPDINIDQLLSEQQLRHTDAAHTLRTIRIAVIVILLSLVVVASFVISGFLHNNTQKLKTMYHKTH